jgi:hypothetical protein
MANLFSAERIASAASRAASTDVPFSASSGLKSASALGRAETNRSKASVVTQKPGWTLTRRA